MMHKNLRFDVLYIIYIDAVFEQNVAYIVQFWQHLHLPRSCTMTESC